MQIESGNPGYNDRGSFFVEHNTQEQLLPSQNSLQSQAPFLFCLSIIYQPYILKGLFEPVWGKITGNKSAEKINIQNNQKCRCVFDEMCLSNDRTISHTHFIQRESVGIEAYTSF